IHNWDETSGNLVDFCKLNDYLHERMGKLKLGSPMISLVFEELRSVLHSYTYPVSSGSEESMSCEDSVHSGCEDFTAPNEWKMIHNSTENGKS
ncbi:hypothetical protein PENTCL1PPCAC_8290, partial [Pristionchus entomophagus]